MPLRVFCIVALFCAGGLGTSVYFSNHGLKDYVKLRAQVRAAEKRTAIIETDNQRLRQRLKVLDEKRSAVSNRELREVLGWVKAEELVYLESTRK